MIKILLLSGFFIGCNSSEDITYDLPSVKDFNENRSQEIKELCEQGIVPGMHDMKRLQKEGNFDLIKWRPHLMGQGAGAGK